MAEEFGIEQIEPGMIVEASEGDLGEDDLSKPRVDEVVKGGDGAIKKVIIEKGTLFKKQVEVSSNRIIAVVPEAATADGEPGKVKLAISEEETEALGSTGAERVSTNPNDILSETEQELPTEAGLRRMETDKRRRERGERRPAPASPGLMRVLGPGFLAGIASNDSAAVTTYAVDGARVGYIHLWLLLLTTPLLQAVQFACARIGRVQRKGFSEVLRENYGLKLAGSAAALLVLANLGLIAADLVAVGSGLELISGIAWPWFVIPVAAALWYMVVYQSFDKIKKIFLVLSLVFATYLITAVLSKPDWGEVLRDTFIPQLDFSFNSISAVVALLGATISPWAIFWQVQGEKEEVRPGATDAEQIRVAAWDIGAGVVSANLVAYAIIISAGAAFAGPAQINTALDAARSMEPLLGPLAKYLFAAGLIGAGLVAVPILLASTSYAVAGAVGWPTGLSKKPWQAEGFYLIITAALVSSLALGLTGINAVTLLFWANVLQGVAAPILLIILLFVGNSRKVMGQQRLAWPTNLGVGLTTLLMLASAALLFYGLLTGQGG